MNFIKGNEKGVTLIELLVAASLLTIVLITFIAFFTNSFRYNTKTSEKVIGVNFIREKQVSLNDSPAFANFIINISDTEVTASDLSKDNSLYVGLNLMEDIMINSSTSRPVTLTDGSIINESYYLLKLNSDGKKLSVYVKENPDYNNLYRVYIETYDKNDKLLSESYMYYEKKSSGDGT
ncbi:type IV pilus modification PilV family protein [Neobacillus sp. LXY-4]|uniref:type IV pilus modification PilV family protein n=1 Tax=Neobacillus sp. LXY-4 TaxID=3379826 RepID=UPI003EE38DD7